MSALDSPIPTAYVVPIVEEYARSIRPAFSFILIASVFSAMLIPLLVMLFALSTSHTRQMPIFILNVLAIFLGLVVGALCGHLTMQSILSPFVGIDATEDVVYNVLYIWMPWITEAILLLRVIVVFTPNFRLLHMTALLTFPITIKAARAIINIVFLVQWKRSTSSGVVNQFDTTQSLRTWMVKTGWILELIDNAYISFLFLWRLSTQAHLFNASKFGRVDLDNSRGSFRDKLKSLFWIASTNFVFPLIFGLCQIILLFVGNNILIAASVEMVNVYISIISTVLASIWSSTSSKDAGAAPYSRDNDMEPISFHRNMTPVAIRPSRMAGTHETLSQTDLDNVTREYRGENVA